MCSKPNVNYHWMALRLKCSRAVQQADHTTGAELFVWCLGNTASNTAGGFLINEAKPRPQHGWRWQESQHHYDEGRHDTRTVPTSSTVKVGTTQG